MGKSYLIHAAWVVVAFGAFVFGSLQRTGDEEEPLPTSSAETKSNRRAAGQHPSGLSGALDGPGGVSFVPGQLLSPEQMQVVMRSVLSETDLIRGQRLFAGLLESITAENAQAAMETFLANQGQEAGRGGRFDQLAYLWGRLDGEGAVAFAREQEIHSHTRENVLNWALSGWATEEPDLAEKALEGMTWRDRYAATRGFIRGVAQNDPDSATNYLFGIAQSTNEGVSRDWAGEFIAGMAKLQFQANLEAALRWGDSLPDSYLKRVALRSLAREYAQLHPAEAATWISQYVTETNTWIGSGPISSVADAWARRDPHAALAWAKSLPEGNVHRGGMIVATFQGWSEVNVVDVQNYLATMPRGPTRDFAVWGHVTKLQGYDPAKALELAASIQGRDSRIGALRGAFRAWLGQNPTAARTWIENAQLPAEDLEQLQ